MNRDILILIVLLIITLGTAWNLYQWKYINDLEKVETGLNIEFEDLKLIAQKSNNSEDLIEKIEEIETYSYFQQTYCFSGE